MSKEDDAPQWYRPTPPVIVDIDENFQFCEICGRRFSRHDREIAAFHRTPGHSPWAPPLRDKPHKPN
jgi:hypothetical protein